MHVCLCVCTCVETTSGTTHSVAFERGSLLLCNSSSRLGCLANELQGPFCLYLPSVEIASAPHHPQLCLFVLNMESGDCTGSFCMRGECSTNRVISWLSVLLNSKYVDLTWLILSFWACGMSISYDRECLFYSWWAIFLIFNSLGEQRLLRINTPFLQLHLGFYSGQ